jgi:hypothetical protein
MKMKYFSTILVWIELNVNKLRRISNDFQDVCICLLKILGWLFEQNLSKILRTMIIRVFGSNGVPGNIVGFRSFIAAFIKIGGCF